MSYKINYLSLESKKSSAANTQIFISSPAEKERDILGQIFVIFEDSLKKVEHLKFCNFIIREINKYYYQNEKIILMERIPTIKAEHIFESAIAKLNQSVVSFLYEEKIKIRPEEINISIGVVNDKELHFCNIGKNKGLLIYQVKNKNSESEEARYNLLDVTKRTTDVKHEEFNINKLFNSIINGAIPDGGFFVFCNETLAEYLSEKQLIKILTTLPLNGAIEQLRNILRNNMYVSFLGLFIKNNTLNEYNNINTKTIKPIIDRNTNQIINYTKRSEADDQNSSIEDLNLTEEKTSQILNPSGFFNFKKWKPKITLFNKEKIGSINKDKAKIILKNTGKNITPKIKKIGSISKKSLVFSAKTAEKTFKIIASKEKRSSFLLFIKNKTNFIVNSLSSLYTKIKNLNKKSKILLLIISICIIGILSNTLRLGIQKNKASQEKNYQEISTKIKQKQSQIDADLIYGNKDNAKISLEEIKNLLKEIKTEEKNNDYLALEKKYNEQLDSIYQIKRIEKPEIFAEIKTGNADNIFYSDNALYLNDFNSKNLITINKNKEEKAHPYTFENNNKLVTNTKDSLIYYTDKKIGIFSKNEKNFKEAELKNPPLKASAITYYNNRIYLYDNEAKQLYRYTELNNVFMSRLAWLKDSAGLENVKSIAVDGNVYVLNNNEVVRYGGGNKQDFKLDAVEPKLENPEKIAVSEEKNFLYILEPKNKRLIIFNKSGKFLSQYSSDSFTNLKDFNIDNLDQKAYLLNDKTIYKIDIN